MTATKGASLVKSLINATYLVFDSYSTTNQSTINDRKLKALPLHNFCFAKLFACFALLIFLQLLQTLH